MLSKISTTQASCFFAVSSLLWARQLHLLHINYIVFHSSWHALARVSPDFRHRKPHHGHKADRLEWTRDEGHIRE